MENNDFLKAHQSGMEVLGFWTEEYKSTIIHAIEMQYQPEVLIYWQITDIVHNGDKFLTKWHKRYRPLSPEGLQEKYGIKAQGERPDGN